MDNEGRGKKRKLEASVASPDSGSANPICVIHMNDSDNCNFTFISNTKDPGSRFQRIKEICELRLSQPTDSPHRMQCVCQQIPETFTSQHRYHRDCYQRFSSNLNRLTKPSGEKPSSVSSSVREPRRSSTEKDSVLFQPDCIFCNKSGRKSIKVRGSWTTESTTSFAFGGGGRILEVATEKNDTKLLRRITGFDLFACEARFHESCRTQYLQTPQKWRSQNPANVEQQTSLETAHKQAFDKVCIIIDRQVLIEQKVIKLSELLN